jgi:drug/metabolite transporter (DMT)-like permease
MSIRNIFMIIHSLTLAFSFAYLQNPIIYTISNTGPIIVFVLDYFINKISISKKQLYGIVFTVIGLLLTVNSNIIINFLTGNE